ncbi:GAF domain-containing protein [Actinokineospora xionganensis]|uniref:GAF domain-containing protein n=1 Tax=Actinokineospora xionganensis TaxID=2684470 RepID=A0ABR7LCN0_9PSEU|nr:GAF domain-containing protein [Actinokineospora xionganensis]MBC6450139.1 GAF domain-containing protein [Actinokineospora xionganensis]
MNYDMIDSRLLTAPNDPEVGRRLVRLQELGLGGTPDPEFDAFATELAEAADAPYAMVNFIGENEQYFAGLHVPSSVQADALKAAQSSSSATPSRTMARDHGYCPHVVVRRKALVLDDVCSYPRFAVNPVINSIGVRAYMGAPLIDRTGTALGTICVVATEESHWGRPGLELIKSMAAKVVDLIHQRER